MQMAVSHIYSGFVNMKIVESILQIHWHDIKSLIVDPVSFIIY